MGDSYPVTWGTAAAQVMVIVITADNWNKWGSADLVHFSCINMKGREYSHDPNVESQDETGTVTVVFSLPFSQPDYTPY